MSALQTVLLLLLAADPSLLSEPSQIDPVPRALLTETLQQWTFDQGDAGWVAEHDCKVSARGGVLRIDCTGGDPYLHHAVDFPGGGFLLELTARCRTAGGGEIFWTTQQSPRRGNDKMARFALHHDGQWHDYAVGFTAAGRLADLRIDPGNAPGEVDIRSIRLLRAEPHPLVIEHVDVLPDRVRAMVKNHGAEPLEFLAGGRPYRVAGGATVEVEHPIQGKRPLEAVTVELSAKNLPPVRRTIFIHHEKVETEWIVRPSSRPAKSKIAVGAAVALPHPERGSSATAAPTLPAPTLPVSLLLARDGSVVRIQRAGRLVAVLGPLVHCDGKLPALKAVEEGPVVRFQGEGISLSVALAGDEVSISIDSRQPCEGPVVRAPGRLEAGLFAGLEYLERDEKSSSTLDIETPEHLRFAPDPLKVTMPLMTLATDRASLAMTWRDMKLQPVFATPNFFDCTGDHRMALRGKRIEATLRVSDLSLEETIFWAVKKRGLPPLPEPPRSPQQQWQLCIQAFNGPLRSEAGWGHCVEANWARQPFADIASTVWRLTGEAPNLPRLVPGGSHVRNHAIYFVTGRAQQWLAQQSQHVQGILRRQRPDGSFRYDGPFRRGHFEDTASGVCARPAAELLEYARITGDKPALAAGIRALEYMKRFRVPRGAQVWEIPLHTPDQLASAYAVWACVRGYELTGNKEHLAEARRWALSGVPLVYLWGRYPIMPYATPPVFGATNWKSPNWMGLPVQWVGGVYAYALTMLAPYDKSLDWSHLARGILISAEQQQYPDGPHAGLLPDSFALPEQRRQPANINPSAVVSLRMALDGQVDSLAVAADAQHRVAAPFPVSIRDGQAHIRARAGAAYQVLIDGRRVVDVKSAGEDTVRLDDVK